MKNTKLNTTMIDIYCPICGELIPINVGSIKNIKDANVTCSKGHNTLITYICNVNNLDKLQTKLTKLQNSFNKLN